MGEPLLADGDVDGESDPVADGAGALLDTELLTLATGDAGRDGDRDGVRVVAMDGEEEALATTTPCSRRLVVEGPVPLTDSKDARGSVTLPVGSPHTSSVPMTYKWSQCEQAMHSSVMP